MNFITAATCSVTVIVAFLAASHSASGKETVDREFPAGIRLPDEARGEAAIAALANRLPEVAAFHGKSPQRLRELFRADQTLWVNPEGELFYACELNCTDCDQADTSAEGEEMAESIGATDPPPFDTAEAFLLHSRPGANRVIYLDFDGHADASGKWKAGAESPPFDLDGNASTFNTTERNRIIGIWQRVAEDYSMYEIDVTTEDPGIEALRKANSSDAAYGIRVVIGGSSSDWYGRSAGGVAFVGSFDSNTDTPCWVFPKAPGAGISEKNIAEAASHEAGHTLGLYHDGVTDGPSYYNGQGNWAPIMGASFSRNISQWSRGEYTDANNVQDDLAVMLTQGAVYRADDHGDSNSSATELSADSDTVSVGGVIQRSSDVDFFRIEAAGGALVINAEPAPSGPNLRIEVKLFDAAGSLLQTATSADTSSGTQPVTLTRTVAAGTAFISVDGIGNGDPATTGYSDYSSLGQYKVTITGIVPGGFTWLPVAAGIQQWNNAGNWAPNTIPNAAGETLRINNNLIGDQIIQLASPTTLGTLFLGDANSSHGFTLASSGGSLIFDNLGNPANLSKTTGTNDLISVPLLLNGALDITQSASRNLSFSGGISGSGALTKAGAGAVVFSTANSYTGPTVLEDGLLRLDAANGLPGGIDNASGPGESALIFKGGVVGLASADFSRALGNGDGELNWTSGSGGFAAFGDDRQVRLNNGAGAVSWSSAIIGGGNVLILGHSSATHTLDFENGISFAGTQRTIRVEDGQAAVDAILSGVLSGGNSSGLEKTGSGVLSLAKANTYNGSTTLDGGVLLLQNTNALPSGNLELTGGGILGLGAGNFDDRVLGTGSGELQWTGEGGFAAFGTERTVKFSASSINWSATHFIGPARALLLGHETADATLDWQQRISLAGSERAIQVDDGSAAIDAKMSGVIAGGSSGTSNVFNKTGVGTLAFTAQNTHWGDTIVSAGTLMIGDGGTTGGVSQNSPNIIVETGAILATNRSDTLTQGTNSLNAVISGDGGFAQVGGGTTVLTLANTFSGPTTVTGGTLALGASDTLPDASGISIGSATLDAASFTDTVGTLDITSTATINLGAGAALSFADSSEFVWTGGLNLTGAFVSGSSLRFGNNVNGLTSSQLALISINGATPPLALDANGYLIQVPGGYAAWEATHAPNTGDDPNADEDRDGVTNGVEYVLGGRIDTHDLAKLPAVSLSGENMLFTFKRDQASIDGSTALVIQTGTTLSAWPNSYIVGTSTADSAAGVSIIENTPSGFDTVTLTLPLGADVNRFARLMITP
ncbi:autotransporter-associated beta strand repeat-containing protein [Haloferula sp.]|uniref:autotransporter-associated beta strand repeat-containing protein n=1 Tax=Haloferula sp. TaxID=2497595 RepID=UPI003C753E6C